MEEEVVNSDESYTDDDEEEELDPRIQDELEKLNAATNSINHLEAELDEARAVFRQTLAGATQHLNGVAQKLGKCVDKSRPFYESYRQLRQSHGMLQKSTNQFERATGMHIAARTRVQEAEKRVFGAGPKRAFDTALQEMLNQATIEVNEAEKLKRDSWKQHQEDLKAYRDLELKVKKLYKKLKSSVEKAKPYFEQKKDFDRHLWQLKLRVDSILLGLSGAKENYSACLKSLEVISDDIHEKRKSKRMETMLSKLQERESGVGADSSTEDETSLHASNLDLDFDSSLNFDKLDVLSDDLGDDLSNLSTARAASCSNLEISASGGNNLTSDTRVVYGLESSVSECNKDRKEQTVEGDSYKQSEDTKTKDIDIAENSNIGLEVNKQLTEDKSSDIEVGSVSSSTCNVSEDLSKKSTTDESINLENTSHLQSSQDEISREDSTIVVQGDSQSQTVDISSLEKERSCQDEVRQGEVSPARDELSVTDEKTLQVEASEAVTTTHGDEALSSKSESEVSRETSPNQILNVDPVASGEESTCSQNQINHDNLPKTNESRASEETSLQDDLDASASQDEPTVVE
ncbi:SH3 domain-binding protein 5 [Exaiptasia diaphana]|uniref:SH3 domain-binding protein 5-like n=1 Tax=Exaiptasia diaphana TaxID=2652724 RepID=A0A913XVH6_EXADI|nr:SH3 domain-binding protein 5 [Exaiptasia diaphana]KXJ08487.1 SH3 domain-binding protein 5 [Exaiptasia diaphana]